MRLDEWGGRYQWLRSPESATVISIQIVYYLQINYKNIAFPTLADSRVKSQHDWMLGNGLKISVRVVVSSYLVLVLRLSPIINLESERY